MRPQAYVNSLIPNDPETINSAFHTQQKKCATKGLGNKYATRESCLLLPSVYPCTCFECENKNTWQNVFSTKNVREVIFKKRCSELLLSKIYDMKQKQKREKVKAKTLKNVLTQNVYTP